MDYIPVVDLSKVTGGNGTVNDKDFMDTAEEVFRALSGIGFVYLKNHGVNGETIEKAFTGSRRFFELPQDVKDKSAKDITKGFGNGYNPPGSELLNADSTYEIRETYDFSGIDRIYPEDCPEFGPSLSKLEEACKPLAKILMRIMALSLKLDDKEYFVTRSNNLDDPNVKSYTTLRSLYYPPIPDFIPAGTVRLADHTDYGFLTLLFQDQIGGLQVKSINGKWVKANPIPGTILVNTGNLLEFWSGGKFPATHHQVLIPKEEVKQKTHRQSIVLFVHPDDDVIVAPLIGNAAEYATVTARDHAIQKLATSYK